MRNGICVAFICISRVRSSLCFKIQFTHLWILSFAHLSIGFLVFSIFNSPSHIRDISPLSVRNFLPVCHLPLTLFVVFYPHRKVSFCYLFIWLNWLILNLLWILSPRKSSPTPMSKTFIHVFCSTCMVSIFTFRSLIGLFILVYAVSYELTIFCQILTSCPALFKKKKAYLYLFLDFLLYSTGLNYLPDSITEVL